MSVVFVLEDESPKTISKFMAAGAWFPMEIFYLSRIKTINTFGNSLEINI